MDVGILIEHYSGNLPLWLSPVQVILLNITDTQREYTSSLNEQLQGLGLRSECDLSNEKIGYKIRNHAMTRVPYMIIIGDKELQSKTVSVRDRAGNDLGTMSTEKFSELIKKEID